MLLFSVNTPADELNWMAAISPVEAEKGMFLYEKRFSNNCSFLLVPISQ